MSAAEDKTHRSIWQHLRDVPFEQGFVDAGGVRTRYVHAGQKGKPALVMIHGTAGHWEAFSANLGAHAAHFDCYGLDLMGSGFSDKPNRPYEIHEYVSHVLAFMDAMGLTSASVVGMSLGAWVAAATAIKAPERVEKLQLLSAAGYFSSDQNRARIKSARTSAVENPAWHTVKAIFDRLMVSEASRIDDLVALRQAIYRQPEMRQAMENILVLQDAEIRERNLIPDEGWKSISAPTMIIGSLGDADEYLETARVVSRLIPNATYIEMADVGHWPQWEDPETYNAHSLKFLLG